MPKGRGARDRGRRPRVKGKRPKKTVPLDLTGIVGASRPTHQDMQRRADAAAAGGFTREERKRSRQREREAQRLAARRVAQAAEARRQ